MNPNAAVNWWANEAIRLPATTCPASPDGTLQATDAFVLTANQGTVYFYAFLATLVGALVCVVLTYRTRTMGELFARRWWTALAITTFVSGVVCLLVVLGLDVNTFGCEYGNVATRIPVADALERASVALTQGALAFVAFSVVLTRLARLTRRQPWFNNSRYPF